MDDGSIYKNVENITIIPLKRKNETIWFTCEISISGHTFKLKFHIYIYDSDAVYIVLDPNFLIFIKNETSKPERLFECILYPEILMSRQYFTPIYTKKYGIENLIEMNDTVWTTDSNWSALYVYNCEFSIATKHYKLDKPFVIVYDEDLDIEVEKEVISELPEFTFYNNKSVKIFLFPTPREIILDKSIQFTIHRSSLILSENVLYDFHYNRIEFPKYHPVGNYEFKISFTIQQFKIFTTFSVSIVDKRDVNVNMSEPNQALSTSTYIETKCLVWPPFISSYINMNLISLTPNSIFKTINDTIELDATKDLTPGEYVFQCSTSNKDLDYRSIYYFITIMDCITSNVTIFPPLRNMFIDQVVFCAPAVSNIIPSHSFNFQVHKIEYNHNYQNCSLDKPAMHISFFRKYYGFKLKNYMVNCKIEFVCTVNFYAGYSLLHQQNKTFVRKLISNISIEFFPDTDQLELGMSMICRMIDSSTDPNPVIKMTIMSDNDKPVPHNKFQAELDTEGGIYSLRCIYMTIFGETRMITKDVKVVLQAYHLTINGYKFRVDEAIICKTNGFPELNFNYLWKFVNGPTNFIFTYKNRLYFEEISLFGYYNISCSVSAFYENRTIYLEKLFTVKIAGYVDKINYKYSETQGVDWITKVGLTWLLLYLLLFLGTARYVTWSRSMMNFTGFGLTQKYRDNLLIYSYVVKFEPNNQLTFHCITSYSILISHYYIPINDEEFYIEYNQNILENPYTHDTQIFDLKPLHDIISILDPEESDDSDNLINEMLDMTMSFDNRKYFRMSMSSFETKRADRYYVNVDQLFLTKPSSNTIDDGSNL